MSWKHLTYADLALILAGDELTKLNTLSKGADWSAIVEECMDTVADTWRGALASKGYVLDVRDHYIPGEYVYYVLVHCRHAVWTRFPHSDDIALDQRREDEYRHAMDLLENPYIGPSKPDPEWSGDSPINGDGGGSSIANPPLRFPPWFLHGQVRWNDERGSVLPLPQLSEEGVTSDSVSVSWPEVAGAEKYWARLTGPNGTQYSNLFWKIDLIPSGHKIGVDFFGLSPSTSYTVSVRAFGADPKTTASEWASISLLTQPSPNS